ncbi:MAG: hypothetical protein ACJAT2_003273 [Bacteriovoracaceae bacterium]|jgi:hypothetical protein
MKKLIITLLLGLSFTNVGFTAGYGEDMKGECTKGKDSTRAQEVLVEGSSSSKEAVQTKSKSK